MVLKKNLKICVSAPDNFTLRKKKLFRRKEYAFDESNFEKGSN